MEQGERNSALLMCTTLHFLHVFVALTAKGPYSRKGTHSAPARIPRHSIQLVGGITLGKYIFKKFYLKYCHHFKFRWQKSAST